MQTTTARVTRVTFCLVVALLLAAVQAPAQRALGAIRGRVDIRRLAAPPERRPAAAELETPVGLELADTRFAVVYLETAPASLRFELLSEGRPSLPPMRKFKRGRKAQGLLRSDGIRPRGRGHRKKP